MNRLLLSIFVFSLCPLSVLSGRAQDLSKFQPNEIAIVTCRTQSVPAVPLLSAPYGMPDSTLVRYLQCGEKLVVLSEKDTWAEVRTSQQMGFAPLYFLSPDNPRSFSKVVTPPLMGSRNRW